MIKILIYTWVTILVSASGMPLYVVHALPCGGQECAADEKCVGNPSAFEPLHCEKDPNAKDPTPVSGEFQSGDFVSLSNIEKLDGGGKGLVGYINIAFTLLLTVSSMLAVVFIAIAGVKYMSAGMVSSKEDAKDDISSALIGLLIILASVLILETINPCIVEFNLLGAENSTCEVP